MSQRRRKHLKSGREKLPLLPFSFPSLSPSFPFLSPPLPSPPFSLLSPLFPFLSPPLPLEIGPLNPARRSGECCKLPQGVKSQPSKDLVHIQGQNNSSGCNIFVGFAEDRIQHFARKKQARYHYSLGLNK